MGRVGCRCGYAISDNEKGVCFDVYPEEQMLEMDWQAKIGDMPDPKYDVWKCPKCERLYVFEDGKMLASRVYRIDETPAK